MWVWGLVAFVVEGVGATDMWKARLETSLGPTWGGAGRELRVLNAAVPGWTTYQGRVQLEGVGLAYAPDLVIAGFNNDSGPEVMGDAERAVQGMPRVNAVLWRSELYLLARTGLLGAVRALHPASRTAYSQREAGTRPTYGALVAARRAALPPSVPVAAPLPNLEPLQRHAPAHGSFVVVFNLSRHTALCACG